MEFNCPRCHFFTTKKSTFWNHLHRKVSCPCLHSDETVEEILKQLDTNTKQNPHTCMDCKREFAGMRYLTTHRKKCFPAEQMDIMRKRIDDLEQRSSIATTTTNNLTINITVNNFGSEDQSYITREILQQCLDDMRVYPLLDKIYFDPEHPENHTILLKNEKLGRALIRKNDDWIEVDMNTSVDSMLQKENTRVSRYFFDEIWSNESIPFDNKAYTQAQLVKTNSRDNNEFFEQRRVVKAKIKQWTIDKRKNTNSLVNENSLNL